MVLNNKTLTDRLLANCFTPRTLALLLGCCIASCAIADKKKDTTPLYKDAKAPIEQRVENLLNRMTLKEKILQVNQYTLGRNTNENNIGDAKNNSAEIGSVIYFDQDAQLRNILQKRAIEETRLGIPILFGNDVIHGFRTIFPIPLAQSCSWNPELVKQSCSVAAREARVSGIDWTFSPMLDVAHDPRWGRVAEGYGEDPYVTSVFGRAAVEGYQGNDLTDVNNMATCLKHYVGYGASEAGLDYVYTEISRHTLWNTYLPPFEEAIKAGATAVMSGFHDISGVPASANYYTLTEVLHNKWNFQGFVVSDWQSVIQLINQGVAKDAKECAEKAINAGVDMDMIDNCYYNHLEELIKEGRVSMSRVNDAVRRILRLKFQLGLFEHPFTKEIDRKKRILFPEYKQKAEELAEETMVLLKNSNNILPLKNAKKIALIGPMVNNQKDILGSWISFGEANDVCTISSAMQEEMKDKASILTAEGCDIEGTNNDGFQKAIKTAKEADVVVVCLGENSRWSGENSPWASISLPTMQENLLAEIKKTGKPVILALSAGRPVDLSRIEPLADAIVMMWQPGISGGRPLAGILSGRVNPSGKLSMTFPRTVAQVPIYYNRRPAARKAPLGLYRDISEKPMYEFGYGLSYTTYSYGKIQSSGQTMTGNTITMGKNDNVTLTVDVKNTGKVNGKETVLWYVSDPVCTYSRPIRELRHFEKKAIAAGETQQFSFTIEPERDLSYRDDNGNKIVESGDYFIEVNKQKIKIVIK